MAQKPVTRTAPAAAAKRPVPAAVCDTVVGGGLRCMMIALAQRPGLNARQLGVRARLSSKSGTFGTYLAKMRSHGWLEGSRDNMRLTPEGVAALGSYEPLPTGPGLLAFWLGELGNSGASRILAALASAYPNGVERSQLGEQAGISPVSGTYGTYLAKLRSLELIEGSSVLKASDELFS